VFASSYRAFVFVIGETTTTSNVAVLALLGGGDDLVLCVKNAETHEVITFLVSLVNRPPFFSVLGEVFVIKVGNLK